MNTLDTATLPSTLSSTRPLAKSSRLPILTALVVSLMLCVLPLGSAAQEATASPAAATTADETQGESSPAPQVTIETSMGAILVELDPLSAPESVANFVQYAKAGFYHQTIFHRVIDGFMIQGGGFSKSLDKKITRQPIPNESDNGLSNTRGTIAMARTGDPHSATAQFYINSVDNQALDHGNTRDGWGYTVFGRVIEGMEVVDAISKVPTGAQKGMRNVPVDPVVILKATVHE